MNTIYYLLPVFSARQLHKMKSLIFTFAIAFILQDYRTLQTKQLEDFKPHELAELFKKYALELVTAALPSLVENEEITDGGCECIKGLKKEENWTPLDQVLAIMSIAKHYRSDLEVIRRTADLSAFKIEHGLLQNIRAIVFGHKYSESDCALSMDLDEAVKGYLFKHKVRSSGAPAWTDDSDEILQSDKDCHRSILSIYDEKNEKFFEPLSEGLIIVGRLIERAAKNFPNNQPTTRLRQIINQIRRCELHPVDQDFADEEFEYLQSSQEESPQEELPGKDDSDSD